MIPLEVTMTVAAGGPIVVVVLLNSRMTVVKSVGDDLREPASQDLSRTQASQPAYGPAGRL